MTPQEIIAIDSCFTCTSGTLFQVMQINLLKQILSDLGEPMTQEEIQTESSCFTCLGMSLAEANILVLLNALSTTVAGGAIAATGSGSPEGVVVGNVGNIYADITNHAFWIKETGNGTNTGWLQYV